MRPLEDVRVVSLEQYGAGPFGSLHLADLGAEIIKIEDPRVGGDVGRYVPPYTEGEESLFFESFNRNKRSVSIDMSTEGGRSVFEDLVRQSDAVFSNLRGDVPRALRIRYDDLKDVNPAIVCCSLSGFGMTGPRAAEPGYDYVLQAIAGWMALTGEPDGPPAKSGLSMVDYSGGLVAATALIAGIHSARRDKIGMDCDLSLFDTAISMLTYVGTWHMTAGYVPQRTARSAHPSLVPFQVFQTADSWVVVGCAKEKFWLRLLDVIDAPDIRSDQRFKDFASRLEHKDELLARLDKIFLGRTSSMWLNELRAAGVPCGPVNSIDRALSDPQTDARGMIVRTQHPVWGEVRSLASPVRVGDETFSHRRAPHRNEDVDYVLHDVLGYDDGRVGELAAAGAFGDYANYTDASA